MDEPSKACDHISGPIYEREEMTEPMLAFRLYGVPSNFGCPLEVSFIERKKDEQLQGKRAKVLEVPAVEGIYYLSLL